MDPTVASVWTLVLGAECISELGAQVRCEQTTAGLFPSGPGCPWRWAGHPWRWAGLGSSSQCWDKSASTLC